MSERTAGKWVKRYLAEGKAGLLDRSSAPHEVHNRTPEDRIQLIGVLRGLRMSAAEIAELLSMPETTVSGILTRTGLGRLGRLGMEPARRYERSRPGELLHIDVKKLGRIEGGAGHRVVGRQRQRRNPTRTDAAGVRRCRVGYECVHVCVDDATRLAYVEVLSDEKATTAVSFLRRAIAFYRSHGVSRRARDDRQRLGLSLRDPRDRLPGARDPTPAHPPLQAPDKRQGRALHPHDARRLGLRRDLPKLGRAHCGARGLAMALQLQTTPRLPRPKTTRQLGSPS